MSNTKRAILYSTCAVGVLLLLLIGTRSPALKRGITSKEPQQQQQTARGTTEFVIDWDSYIPDINQYLPITPKIDVPDTSLATILPTVDIPTVSIESELTKPIALPDTTTTNILNTSVVEISVPEIEQVLITVPKTAYDMNKITKLYARHAKLQTMFRDKRRIQHDRTLLISDNIETWFPIYDTFTAPTVTSVPMDTNKKLRIISEVRLPKSDEQFGILRQNLLYYKARGYTHALVMFDGTEKPSDLINLCKYVRYRGLSIYSTFGGAESLDRSAYPNANVLAEQIKAVATYSDGFILGWRSTSAHLLLQDPAYTNYLAHCARLGNPSIKLIGELYYGNTAQYPHENKWGFGHNTIVPQSAVLLCNFGYSNTDIASVVKRVAPAIVGKYPLIAVVTGQKPYYLTFNLNNLTQEQNQQIKERIEQRFIDAGCIGTITLHDDGRDSASFSNNLCSKLWSDMTTHR